MGASTNCITCNSNWASYINADSLAMLMTKESGELL